MTVWKAIPGFPDYEASDDGEIKRVTPSPAKSGGRTWVGRILKQQLLPSGYKHLLLVNNGKSHTKTVHSLIALTFIGPKPSKKHEVAHNDGEKSNNKASNLRWVTRKENAADRERHGRTARGCKVGTAKLNEQEVIEILKSPINNTAAGRKYKVSKNTIRNIRIKQSWKHINIGM